MPIEPRSVMQSFFYNSIIFSSIYFHPQRWPQLRRHQSESSSPPQSLQILRWFSSNKIFSSFCQNSKNLCSSRATWSPGSGLSCSGSSPPSSHHPPMLLSPLFVRILFMYILIRESFIIERYYIYLCRSSKELSSPCWSPSPLLLCWRFLIGSIC